MRGHASALGWFKLALEAQRRKIGHLLDRLQGFGGPQGLKPSLLHKFFGMLTQIASERDEEIRILKRIEDAEEQHQALRRSHRLDRAGQSPQFHKPSAQSEDAPAPQRRSGLLWLLTLMALFGGNKGKNVNEPRPD